MKSLLAPLCAATVIASAAFAPAALTGFTDFDIGGTTASWDIFYGDNYLPNFIFPTGTAGNPIENSSTNLSLNAAVPNWTPWSGMGPRLNQATGPIGTNNEIPGNRIYFYTYFANPVNFSITGIVSPGEELDLFAFQALQASGGLGGLLNVQLNGQGASDTGTNGNGVQYWTWSELELNAGDTFVLTWSMGGHSNLDAVQIQTDAPVQAVPEPSTWALLVLGSAAVILTWRSRTARTC